MMIYKKKIIHFQRFCLINISKREILFLIIYSNHSRFPINFPKLLSRERYIFDGVKQIEERNNEVDLTRSTLHIMGRHKLQCTEAAIHHTGVLYTVACWRNCTQWFENHWWTNRFEK